MKKIITFAVVVVALIAVIKIGGPVLTASMGGETDQTTQTVADGTEEPGKPGESGAPGESGETREMITIEISNETGETQPETAEASIEAENEALVQERETAAAATVPTTAAAVKTYAVKEINKTMYAIKAVNVRESYSTDSAILSSLKAGQEVHATGESDNGWIRIDYSGKTAYVAKSYLSANKADVETTAARQTTAASGSTRPAETRPSATQPAASQPSPAPTPAPTSGNGSTTETIAPFPG